MPLMAVDAIHQRGVPRVVRLLDQVGLRLV